MLYRILHTLKFTYEVYIKKRRTPIIESTSYKHTGELDPNVALTSQTVVFSMNNVYSCGASGFIFNSKGKLDSLSAPIKANSKIRRPILFRAEKFEAKSIFHLVGESSSNRAHFMFEQGARLLIGIKENIVQECDAILVHSDEQNWLHDYLSYFEIEDKPLVRTSKLTTQIDALKFVPGPSTEIMRFNDPIYEELGNFLQATVKKKLGTIKLKKQSVWLSRRDAPARSCQNIDEIQDIFIKSTGLEINELSLQNLSLNEQIIALCETKIIIAEEGQALNLLPFISNKLVVIIDQGKGSSQSPWCQAFERMAKLVGNEVICLFNGAEEKEVQWKYPANKFGNDLHPHLEKISPTHTQLASPASRDSMELGSGIDS